MRLRLFMTALRLGLAAAALVLAIVLARRDVVLSRPSEEDLRATVDLMAEYYRDGNVTGYHALLDSPGRNECPLDRFSRLLAVTRGTQEVKNFIQQIKAIEYLTLNEARVTLIQYLGPDAQAQQVVTFVDVDGEWRIKVDEEARKVCQSDALSSDVLADATGIFRLFQNDLLDAIQAAATTTDPDAPGALENVSARLILLYLRLSDRFREACPRDDIARTLISSPPGYFDVFIATDVYSWRAEATAGSATFSLPDDGRKVAVLLGQPGKWTVDEVYGIRDCGHAP